MPYFIEQQYNTVQLPSQPTYWIKLCTTLKWKEVKAFANINEKGDVTYALDQLLLTLIKEWNLDDDQGEVLEISQENIDRLTREDIEVLIAAVGSVVESQTPDQKKSSSKE
ncbi:MAG: hypothetical protein QFB87_04510 [Patescibacteria group bacterium]|nr:hypothetical protein [Patescibacteria group bacterium]